MGFFSRRRKQTQRIADVEAELDRARNELTRVIREETDASTAEIQRLLARERADTLSRLEEEERKIAEERRRDILERERQAGSELSMKLAEAQERVEQRYASWSADLDRTHQALTAELKKLAERQKVLVGQAESRLQDDREKIDEAGELQVTAVQKLREELQRASELAAQELRAELDAHGAERRRALEEMSQRLKTRERQLAERVEREETDVVRRIQARFVDIERRQVEALERTTKQAAGRFAEAAALQFDAAVKSAREDAARRLARELDRAVHMFAREAETVLAERLGAGRGHRDAARREAAAPGHRRPRAAARRVHRRAPAAPEPDGARGARPAAHARRRSGGGAVGSRPPAPGALVARRRASRSAASSSGSRRFDFQLRRGGFVYEKTNQSRSKA